MHTRSLTAALAALPLAVALVACSSPAGSDTAPPPEPQPQQQAPAFPRSVDIPAGTAGDAHAVTIDTRPAAIAALDYESAEVLAELGLGDRVVLVPEAVLQPALGGHIDELKDVPATFPVAMNLDVETVIQTAPDLVVLSPRHGAEDSIGAVLEQAGLTTLLLPEPWSSPDALAGNIRIIGEATDTETAATALTDAITAGLDAHTNHTLGSATTDAPRVLVLTNQAGRAFATAGHAFPLHLLDRAGATSVTDELGMRATQPISAEQIVEAQPDGIVLIDMNGSGDRMYQELLQNPAVAALPAAAEDRLLRVSGREVQALGLQTTATGLKALTAWVQTLRQ